MAQLPLKRTALSSRDSDRTYLPVNRQVENGLGFFVCSAPERQRNGPGAKGPRLGPFQIGQRPGGEAPDYSKEPSRSKVPDAVCCFEK